MIELVGSTLVVRGTQATHQKVADLVELTKSPMIRLEMCLFHPGTIPTENMESLSPSDLQKLIQNDKSVSVISRPVMITRLNQTAELKIATAQQSSIKLKVRVNIPGLVFG